MPYERRFPMRRQPYGYNPVLNVDAYQIGHFLLIPPGMENFQCSQLIHRKPYEFPGETSTDYRLQASGMFPWVEFVVQYGVVPVGLTAHRKSPCMIVIPALLNMGVVLGLLPTKGMVLPLVGYGGSSLIASLVSVGLLLSIARSTHRHGL